MYLSILAISVLKVILKLMAYKNYLVIQAVYRYFANTNKVTLWKSKGFSNKESIKPPAASNDTLVPALNYIITELQVKFDGSCLKQDKTTFTHKEVVNICIVYEIKLWPFFVGKYFALGNYLLLAFKLPKNADPNKYSYSSHGIRFDASGSFSLLNGSGFGKM